LPSKEPSKKPKRKDPVGGSETPARTQALRQAYLAVQIKAMQRAAEPLTVKYSMETVDEIKQFNRTLADMVFSRQLGHHDIQALNGIIRNQLQILIPRPGIQIIQTQTVVTSEQDWKKLFEETPEEDRLVVARFIKRLAEREVSPSSS